MRPLRRLLPILLVSAIWLAQAAPAFALLGWSASASQTSVKAGQSVVVTYTVSNDNLLSLLGIDDIGCVHVNVGSSFEIQSIAVVSAPGEWQTAASGSVAVVHSRNGGGRLGVGQSVRFSITAVAEVPGSHAWTTRVIRDQGCDGSYIAGSESFTVHVAAAPTATPSPTPSPTPVPTPVPTPKPTPKPTARPTATPTPVLPMPLPSVPLSRPSLPPPPGTPAPTDRGLPSGSDEPRPSTPRPSPSGLAANDGDGTASPQARPSAAPSEEAATPVPNAVHVGGGPSDGGTPAGGVATLAFPIDELTGELAVEITNLSLLTNPVWGLPAAVLAGPGLLVLLWLSLQAIGAAAWIPAVRRLRGDDRSVS